MDTQKQFNTATLQKRFSDVYRDFFVHNPIVTSTQIYFPLTPGMSWRVGAPTIAHRMDLRCYVGLHQQGEQGTIQVGTQLVFYSQHDEFRESDYEMLKWKKCLSVLSDVIRAREGESFNGLTFDVLIEMPENRAVYAGLSFTILSFLYLYFGWAAIEQLDQIKCLSSTEIQSKSSDLSKLYHQIITHSLKVRAEKNYGVTSGLADYASVLKSKYPLVYFTEERAGSIEKPVMGLPPLDTTKDMSALDDFRVWPFRLNELVDDITGPFPFDVVSIYPGANREYGSASIYTTRGVIPSFDQMRDQVKLIFKDLALEDERAPSFLKNLDIDGLYWQRFARGQTLGKLYLLLELINVYREKYKTSSKTQFLETLDSLRFINAPFEETPSRNVRHIQNAVFSKASEVGENIAIRNLNFGKQDGNIIVFSMHQKFRDEIFEVVEKLQEKNPKIHIDFASWRDGFGGEGYRTEQIIDQGLYSAFIDKESKFLLHWTDNRLEQKIVQNAQPEKFDLFLNGVTGRLFVGGKPVTSKEVPSQKAAIEIIGALLRDVCKPISNKVLPGASYASYRNEFQGKITGPIERVLQERVGKPLGMSVSGQLTEFDVKFEPRGLSVGLLSRI